jgi:hypothetical protein
MDKPSCKKINRFEEYLKLVQDEDVSKNTSKNKNKYDPALLKKYVKSMSKYTIKDKEISPCGKFIYTYYTVSDLEGNLLSTYWMNVHGRKGLSDQYKIYKLKQIIDAEPEKFSDMREYVECLEKLYSIEKGIFNKKTCDVSNSSETVEQKIAKDLGWIK